MKHLKVSFGRRIINEPSSMCTSFDLIKKCTFSRIISERAKTRRKLSPIGSILFRLNSWCIAEQNLFMYVLIYNSCKNAFGCIKKNYLSDYSSLDLEDFLLDFLLDFLGSSSVVGSNECFCPCDVGSFVGS